MKVLVTGGAGFIGSHLTDRLIDMGHDVVVVDNLATGKPQNVHKKAYFYKTDVRFEGLRFVFEMEKPGAVFHLAAQTEAEKALEDPSFDGEVNILGTLNLLNLMRDYGVGHLIFASSAAVYGPAIGRPFTEADPAAPASPGGISKLSAEQYIRLFCDRWGIAWDILRLGTVYGSRQPAGAAAAFLEAMKQKRRGVIHGDGLQTRDFIHVSDAVRAHVYALEAPGGGSYNVGTGRATSIQALYGLMASMTGAEEGPLYEEAPEGSVEERTLDISKIKSDWGFEPAVSLREGLRRMMEANR